jgi:hypothetical protein
MIDQGVLAGLQGKVVTQEGSRVLITIEAGIYVEIDRQWLKPVRNVAAAPGPGDAYRW